MRTLLKNKREMYYANPVGTQQIYDAYGYITNDVETLYEDPVLLKANYSACSGQEATAIFGDISNYSRTILLDECPIVEGAKIWIGRDTTLEANYKATKIADSINVFAIALTEIV